MNLVKKLVFGLLLSGTLFAVGCAGEAPTLGGSDPAEHSVADGGDCTDTVQCKAAGSTCESNKCKAPDDHTVDDGGACSDTVQCKAAGSTCESNKCKAPDDHSVADNGACSGDVQCHFGSTCESNKCKAPDDHSVADNSACSGDVQCHFGSTCESNKCKAPDDHSVADNGACSDTKQCSQPGSSCYAKTHKCMPPLPSSVDDGNGCGKTEQCSQPGSTCDETTHTCTPPGKYSVPNDGACSKGEQCKSGVCASNKCTSSPEEGTSCKSSKSTCKMPLVCLNRHCEQAPAPLTLGDGQPCSDSKQCAPGLICDTTDTDRYVCKPDQTPGKKQSGDACKATSECDTDLVCLGKMGAQTCQDKPKDGSLKEGAFCSDDKQCETGFACKQTTAGGDMVCVKDTLAGLGEACSKPSDCLSNICDNSICVPADKSVDLGGRCLKDSQCKDDSYPMVCITVKPQVSLCLLKCKDASASESDCHKSATEFECKSLEKSESGTAFACEPPIAHKGDSCANGEICDGNLACNQSTHVCE